MVTECSILKCRNINATCTHVAIIVYQEVTPCSLIEKYLVAEEYLAFIFGIRVYEIFYLKIKTLGSLETSVNAR
jgi:hypothetical protein